MGKITESDVLHIARLSRLRLTPKEAEEMRGHLENVLREMETLNAVDVSGVPASAHILPFINVLREDTVQPSMDNALLLSNAPEIEDGYYVVPKVLD